MAAKSERIVKLLIDWCSVTKRATLAKLIVGIDEPVAVAADADELTLVSALCCCWCWNKLLCWNCWLA